MKKLVLIRHAKAEKDIGGKDFDRPLKYPGIQDARFMADLIREKGIIPQLIITSPALRTKTTAEIFSDGLKLPPPQEEKSIYEATQQTLLKVVNRISDDLDFVAIVGHNPGIAYILQYLAGEAREVHTCTVALIEFEAGSWTEISGDTGKLTYYGSPKE
jgi:phosphohistidine phosphatase